MKTTKADFKMFKAECEKWIKFFGLLDWVVYYHHYADKNTNHVMGSIRYGSVSRRVDLYLPAMWDCPDTPITPYNIKHTAFHEVCHQLLGPLVANAGARYITPDDIDESEHAIIHRLENSIFDPNY